MNATFKDFDYNQTYSSPWYWEQNYENSLAAQQDYFTQINRRMNSYKLAYQQMAQNNTNPILVEDWYDKSINNLRTEMQREGGLDWAIRGAWFITYAPAAYWLMWWLIPLEMALLLAIVALLIWTAIKSGWTKRKY
jgi:Flp pilus assembly protein TadB